MPPRSAWSSFGEWDPETDPALRRMAEALALNDQDAPGPPDTTSQLPDATSTDNVAVDDPRREVEALTQRLHTGDVSVRDRLSNLLTRLRE